jgi:hypothetical protein
MHSLLLCAAIAAAAVSVATAQDEKKTKKDQEKPVIVVAGCLDGSWLRVESGYGNVERYRLHGTKTLLKEMAGKHNGHMIEVTGAVTDTGNTTHRGKVIPVGKNGRIYTGAKEVPALPTGTGDPILDVASFQELNRFCK